jgi:hypothetical protein
MLIDELENADELPLRQQCLWHFHECLASDHLVDDLNQIRQNQAARHVARHEKVTTQRLAGRI